MYMSGDRLGLYAALAEMPDASPERAGEQCGHRGALCARVARAAGGRRPARRRHTTTRRPDDPALPAAGGGRRGHDRRRTASTTWRRWRRWSRASGRPLPAVLEAFRTGGGVPYAAYGEDLRSGIARLNRPMFLHQLATEWIPAMPDIQARLQRATRRPGSPISAAAAGGRASPSPAPTRPSRSTASTSTRHPSPRPAATPNAPGVGDRVRFDCRDAGDPALAGRYDLVMLFETLHDMADPVSALRAARCAARAGRRGARRRREGRRDLHRPGRRARAVQLRLERAALPARGADRAELGRDRNGHPPRRRCAASPGKPASPRSTVLPVDHDFWRFYRLNP